MKVVFDPAQKGHYPRHFLVNGVVEVNPEVPERADRLFAAAAGAGLAHVVPADPVRFYPFFWGHADERGEGTGLGYNYNLPLPRGTDDRAYMPALDDASAECAHSLRGRLWWRWGSMHSRTIRRAVSPLRPGEVGRIGEAIGKLGLPTVLVQEGGYICDGLGPNLGSFLTGFRSSHGS